MPRYNETVQEREYEQEYEHEQEQEDGQEHEHDDYQYSDVDPDLIETGSVISGKRLVLRKSDPNRPEILKDSISNDPKSMYKYYLNWFGLPLTLYAIYYYGQLIFDQMSMGFPSTAEDLVPIKMALRMRYVGSFVYFMACLLYKRYVFELRNAEGPLIISTVLQIYYMLNFTLNEVDKPTMLQLAVPLMIASACFIRRKPYLRIFMNPWAKDKSELIKLIRDAKETAGFVNDL